MIIIRCGTLFCLLFLSVTDISVLSMASKVVGTQVVGYIATSSGIRRLLLEGFHSTDVSKKSVAMEHYRSLGNFLKESKTYKVEPKAMI